MSLSAFLAENALSVENVKFVASKRFLSDELDDKGKRISAFDACAKDA